MKTLPQWFDEYAESHQNKTNQIFHYFCVPAIFFSIIGMLMSIPSQFLKNVLKLNNPFIENWATVVILFLLVFYIRLSFTAFLKMLLFSALCVIGNYYLGLHYPLFLSSLAIFVIAWIGQFIGHYIEGKKPSFLKDLQFLLIGPAWVIEKVFSLKK